MEITNLVNPNDGFGENYKTIIMSMTYAEFYKYSFLYTPLNNLCHNYDNDPNFDKKKEDMIDLECCFNKSGENSHIISKPKLLHFFDNHLDFFVNSETIKLLKKQFKEKNTNPYLGTLYENAFNIAIHIRRPNNFDKGFYSDPSNHDKEHIKLAGLDVPVDFYILLIKQLLTCYPNSIIHIYSQLTNNEKEFEVYTSIDKYRIVLHIDEELNQTFTSMVYANVLLLSPSSLSYTAGLISNNIVYYIPYCSPPLSHWNVVNGYTSTRKYKFSLKNVELDLEYDSISNSLSIINLSKIFS
jgi:hypothetical protein